MITILKQPEVVSFSRNALAWKFLGTDSNGDAYANYNVRAEMNDTWQPILENDTIEVQWTDAGGVSQSVVFTSKDIPVLENEIASFNTVGISSYTELFQAIADKMNAHSVAGAELLFTQVFNIASQSLFAEAREEGTDFQLSFVINMTNAGAFTLTNNTAPTSTFPTNYKLLLEVYFQTETGYIRVSQNETRADENSIFSFDIQSIIHNEQEEAMPELPIPAFSDNQMMIHNIIADYYIRYREDYDGIVSAIWSVSSLKKSLHGGIAQNLFADYLFFDNMGANNSLLTWYPSGKNVSVDQPEWIVWYNYTGSTKNIILAVSRFDEIGDSNLNPVFDATPLTVASGEVALIPCGVTQLDILTTFSNTTNYKVRVIDADDWDTHTTTAYSQFRTFYLDLDYYIEKRYIMYLNGFNCPETLRCVGYHSNDLEVQREKRNHVLETDYTAASVQTSQYAQTFSNAFTFRSGYLSKIEVDALQELLIYAKAWEIYTEGFITLNLQDSKFKIHETRQFLNAVQIKALPALGRKNYSNTVIPMNNAQESWEIYEEGYWRTVFGQNWQIA